MPATSVVGHDDASSRPVAGQCGVIGLLRALPSECSCLRYEPTRWQLHRMSSGSKDLGGGPWMIGLGAVGLVLLAIGLWRLVRGLTSGVPSRVAVAAAWLVWITQVWGRRRRRRAARGFRRGGSIADPPDVSCVVSTAFHTDRRTSPGASGITGVVHSVDELAPETLRVAPVM
jgi:hypothetical protein